MHPNYIILLVRNMITIIMFITTTIDDQLSINTIIIIIGACLIGIIVIPIIIVCIRVLVIVIAVVIVIAEVNCYCHCDCNHS